MGKNEAVRGGDAAGRTIMEAVAAFPKLEDSTLAEARPGIDPMDADAARASVHAARMRSGAKGRRRKSKLPSVADSLWEDRYSSLSAFAAVHGHFNVPTYYEGTTSLGMWCQRQRHERKRGRLAPNRVSRLEAIGFP